MNTSTTDTESLVERYYRAWGTGDFEGLRPCLGDGFVFDGPLMTATSADEYIDKTRANAAMFAGSDYRRVGQVIGEHDAVVLATLTMGPKVLHTAEHFAVRDGKIQSIRLYFDPTPLRSAG